MTEDDINEHIGENVLRLRLEKGFKQKHIADILGLTRTSVVNIEAGRQGLSNMKLWLLASLFQVQISDLFPPLAEFTIEDTEEEIVVVKRIRAGKKFTITDKP